MSCACGNEDGTNNECERCRLIQDNQRMMKAFKGAFVLTEKQQQMANEFMKGKSTTDCGPIGGRFTFQFTSTSIGLMSAVVDNVTKEEIDLTDYESF